MVFLYVVTLQLIHVNWRFHGVSKKKKWDVFNNNNNKTEYMQRAKLADF